MSSERSAIRIHKPQCVPYTSSKFGELSWPTRHKRLRCRAGFLPTISQTEFTTILRHRCECLRKNMSCRQTGDRFLNCDGFPTLTKIWWTLPHKRLTSSPGFWHTLDVRDCQLGQHLGLRPRGHSYTLPICPNNLCKSSFIRRCLFCFLWLLTVFSITVFTWHSV